MALQALVEAGGRGIVWDEGEHRPYVTRGMLGGRRAVVCERVANDLLELGFVSGPSLDGARFSLTDVGEAAFAASRQNTEVVA